MPSDNVIQLIPDSPFASKSVSYDPGISEHLNFADVSRVGKLVELARKQVAESLSERESLLEADPIAGSFYRSTFRVFIDGATEFEYRNAEKLLSGGLSPHARVEVVFEKSKSPDVPPQSIVIYPREFPSR